jgi:integrase
MHPVVNQNTPSRAETQRKRRDLETPMLTDAAVRAAKPKDKQYRLADERGLYLQISTSGAKLWRFKYRVDGKEKVLAFGQYPDVSLGEARDKRDAARKQLEAGVDPAVQKKALKRAKAVSNAITFEGVAKDWLGKFSKDWSPAHAARVWSRIQRDLLPWVGKTPVADLSAPDVLETIRRIEARGATETAHRARSDVSTIMRYAISCGLATRDPAADVKGALPPVKKQHFAATTDPKGLGKLLVLIDAYEGSHTVRTALKLQPILFCRPGELRQMKWEHLDLKKAVWKLPAEAMKMRQDHIVPLSTQAVALIKDMPKIDGNPYVFPSQRGQGRPMSDMATSAALKSLGIDSKKVQTMHGFRASARTILHEVLSYPAEVIEVQLAHQPSGPLKGAYARMKFIEQRTEMIQAWANYLDGLKAAARRPKT